MTRFRLALPFAALLVAVPLSGQVPEKLPLSPNNAYGQPVAPFFEGWFLDPDGGYTYNLGYFNLNTEELVEIPIGENNFITPPEFNGMQPTSFPGRRNQGVFAIKVPASFGDQEVVWTLKHRGHTLTVPLRPLSAAYDMGYGPMASGSLPPNVRFSPEGESGYGATGIVMEEALTTRVGEPVALQVFIDDLRSRRDPVPLNVQYFKHQGPVGGAVTFDPEEHEDVEATEVSTNASFSMPGDYLVRVRVDNHNSNDSSPGDQCCWTNGYFRVTVTP